MPKFKNGECYKYLAEKVREVYPLEGLSESGKVFVGFVVDRLGKVTNPKVVRSTCKWWNEEALRIVSEMPRWKPGRMNGKAVDVYDIVPLSFFPYMY